MVLSKKNLELFFPDWHDIPKGEWSEHSLELTSDGYRRRYAGLYREPDNNTEYAGSLTLQIMDGDDVVLCDTVYVPEEHEACPFCNDLKRNKDADAFYKAKDPERHGKYEMLYSAAFLSKTFYQGNHCGTNTFGDYPLNFCPVCGRRFV